MSDDDVSLLIAIRDGSELAFNRLVERHQDAVRMFLWRLLGDEADADDMAQEAFLTAWTHARSFRGEASVRGWGRMPGDSSELLWISQLRKSSSAVSQFFRKSSIVGSTSAPKKHRKVLGSRFSFSFCICWKQPGRV